MTVLEIAEAIRNTQLFTAVRESKLFYPFVMSTHLTCIAIFGGMILVTNLRLLGISFKTIPAGELIRTLRPWKYLGGIIMVTAGILLAGSRATAYYQNTYFLLKLSLLGLLIVHAFVFRSIYHNTYALDREAVMPGRAKLAAALSLFLWTAVACAGRWIAYWDAPKAIF